MKRYRLIMAAVDFSRHAKLVVEHAAALARDLEAEIVFANVIDQQNVDMIQRSIDKLSDFSSKRSSNDYMIGIRRDRTNEMKKLMEADVLKGLNIRYVIKIGIPFQALLEIIKEENADLVIMGVKGRADIADVIVGSTAIKMFRRCPVPLVSVREKTDKV